MRKQGDFNAHGFLLVEVLLALALASLVAAGLLAFYWWGSMCLSHHQNETHVRYGARQALEHLSSDIRECSVAQACTQDNRPVAADAAGNRLALEYYSGQSSEKVLYYVNPANRTLYRHNITLNNKLPVAMDIDNILFRHPQPDLLQIELTALAGGVRYHLYTTVYPRVESRMGDW